MTDNSFTAWAKLITRHNDFVREILQNPVYILATTRTKQNYVLVDKNGKMVPQKEGLKGITLNRRYQTRQSVKIRTGVIVVQK